MNVVRQETPGVLGPVCPGELPLALLLAAAVLTLVPRAVRPRLDTLAVLLVSVPLTFINRADAMEIFTLAVRTILEPFSLVDVTVHVIECPLSLCLSFHPLAFIFRSVLPHGQPLAIALTAQHLPGVRGSGFKLLVLHVF